MNFSTAVSTCFSKFVTFQGRAPRSEYWYWVLFVLLGTIVFSAADYAVLGNSNGLISGIFSLVILLPGLAVSVRRLHDIGRSGWWLLLSLIPLIGIIILIVWMIRESDPGDNEFGPNPFSY
ncbi:DUF805 domain-containing protein [Pararhodobacter aggregans]|uniref:DUF805 domain-containing protein n=1 Tax=Pararhodobacter aggregans TaxID=404875 RepID=UPI003A95D4B6